MYSTTTNSTDGQSIYLPAPQTYGGVLNNNSWTTSTSALNWTQSNLVFNENGSEIVDQINKMQTFLARYKSLINGVIYVELVEKLDALLYKLSCIWGLGNSVGFYSSGSSWTNAPTFTQTYPTTWGQYTTGGNTWVKLDNSITLGTTYMY